MNFKMPGKKAVSPLIATVLLIAFAVALGTIVMNWALSQVGGEPADLCTGVKIALERMDEPRSICYDARTQHVKYNLVNVGSTRVEHLRFRLVDTALETQQQDVQIYLQPGAALSESRRADVISPDGLEATITPLIKNEDEEITVCPDMSMQSIPVRRC